MALLTNPAQATAALHQMLPIFAGMELSVLRIDDVLECSVPLSSHNRNHLGTMYAGVQWSAAEVLGGLLYVVHQERLGACKAVVTEVNIKFLKPATSAVRARARFDESQVAALKLELDGEGKAFFELHIDLVDAEDVIVSAVVAKYRYRRL